EITSGHPPFLDFQGESNAFYYLINNICKENLREVPIKGTPLEYQQLYQKCWDSKPNLRPGIEEVYKILRQLRSQYSNTDEQQEIQTTQTTQITRDSDNSFYYGDSLRNFNPFGENQDNKSQLLIYVCIKTGFFH